LPAEVDAVVDDERMLAIMSIVRIADAITKSFVDELKHKLDVPDLDLEV
jgi:hypothetical protein